MSVSANLPSDTELVALVQSGDVQAFHELVQRYDSNLVAFAASLSRSQAEDICQDVWLSVWRNISRFRGGSFGSWLLKIAKYRALDALRKKRPELDGDIADWAVEQLDEPDPRLDALADCLGRLDPDCRRLLQRFYMDGINTRDMAGELGISEGTVGSRASRCRAKVADCMKNKST